MIYSETLAIARPNETLDVLVTGAPDGMLGTIRIRLIDQDGNEVRAPTAVGITEVVAGNGEAGYAYRMPFTVPTERMYFPFWDLGVLTPEATAASAVYVTARNRGRYTVEPVGVVVSAWQHVPSDVVAPGVALLDNDGNTVLARDTTLAFEPASVAGSGFWIMQAPAPAATGDYSVLWDAGLPVTNENSALDPFTVASSAPASGGGAPMPLAIMYCGREVANAARVWEYWRNGYRPTGRTELVVRGDLPSILYRLSGVPEVFTSPVLDPAPWYDPATPESGEFLGLILDPSRSTDLEQAMIRSSTNRPSGLGGTAFGPTLLDGLRLAFTGTLVAMSDCGMEFGKAWLKNTLIGSDPCEQCLTELRVCSPPDDGSDDNLGLWQTYEGVCTQAPTFEDIFAGCHQLVETVFEITAGNPWLYRPEVVEVSDTLLWTDVIGSDCMDFEEWWCGPGSNPICATITSPPYGTNAGILRFDASVEGVGSLLVEVYEAGDEGTSNDPVFRYTIPLVAEGARLVVDSARHEITYYAADGAVLDGSQYIAPEAGESFQWLEVTSDQSDRVVCVSIEHPCGASQTATVSIGSRIRAA